MKAIESTQSDLLRSVVWVEPSAQVALRP
jgi:hypothetical protein